MKALAESPNTYEDACIELGNVLCSLGRNLEGILEYMNVKTPNSVRRVSCVFSNRTKREFFSNILRNWKQILPREAWFCELQKEEQMKVRQTISYFQDWFSSETSIYRRR